MASIDGITDFEELMLLTGQSHTTLHANYRLREFNEDYRNGKDPMDIIIEHELNCFGLEDQLIEDIKNFKC